jgi:hypothetical protein
MTKKLLLILFFAGLSCSFAQEATFDSVKKSFENFKYDEVIKESDKLLRKGNIADSLKIELHLMRANIFYMNRADSLTRENFRNILEIKKDFSPDPTVTAPKLISIFNEVKFDFIRKNPDVIQPADSTAQKPEIKLQKQFPHTFALLKNMAIPGLGQIHHGNLTKGWITAAASALNIGALVFFTVDAGSKQSNYLNETDQKLIQQKYNEYNKSFKLRNTFIITYAAIWLYSQIDLLLFSSEPEPGNSAPLSGLIDLAAPGNGVQLSFRIQF